MRHMLPVPFDSKNPKPEPVALVVAPLSDQALKPLAPHFVLVRWAQLSDSQAWLQQHAHRVQVVITNGVTGLPAGCAEALQSLRLIACNGVGYDAIDLEWARQRGIAVSNTPDVLSADVADLALSLLLAVYRQIPQADRFVRQGAWARGPFPLGRRLSGSRVGILGLGQIGKRIASRCLAFDTEVAYTGRQPQADVAYPYFSSPLALAQWADVLIAATPGGVATRHLVNGPVLDALGSQGVFINIARGSVVDEAALIERLATGRLAAAGLDVFNQEPFVPDTLRALPNTVLSPHIASATVQTRQAMAELLVRNVVALVQGQSLPSRVC